jgi:hypothetical protein
MCFERGGSICVNAFHVVPNDFTFWPFAKHRYMYTTASTMKFHSQGMLGQKN